jgi:hypothetical protein
MAESDAGRSATGTVSTEEAERLSERFRPSWEDDPPTVPREAPAPVAPVPGPAPAAAPTPDAKIPAAASPGVTQPLAAPRRPTLLGMSPEVISSLTAARGTPPEDLDWEVPTRPVPDATDGTRTDKLPAVAAPAPGSASPALGAETLKLPAVAAAASAAPAPAPPTIDTGAAEPELNIDVDVEEVGPDSKPSGIGEKYVPKEEGAPPVVLDQAVQAAELGAQAVLEAQHRARRAPTIARLKVVELPEPPVAENPFVSPKQGNGRFIALAVGVLVLVAVTGLVLSARRKSSADNVMPEHSAVATVAPDTAAPPPPSAAAAPPTQAAAPAVVVAPVEASSSPPPPEKPAEAPAKHAAGATKPPVGGAKPAPAVKAAPGPKPGSAATRPAGKAAGAGAKPAGKAVIVRDSPF